MENHTSLPEFKILPFSNISAYKSYFFTLFILLYVFGILENAIITSVIYIEKQLHTPMYLFLCNLSVIDLSYSTVTVPKLLHMLISGRYKLSFVQCFIQMYFFHGFVCTEVVLLLTMAYDRYVAICKPLHYHRIFSMKHCVQLTVAIWISGYLNSLLLVFPATNVSFCYPYAINQFFCDAKSLMKISCKNTEVFFISICVELLLYGFFSFFVSLLSYIKIISAILKIKSRDGRKKAFSTCSSHLTVLTIFFGTGISVYMMPPTEQFKALEMIFTVLYTVITPILNPLIYCLQNKDVKRALMRCIHVYIKKVLNKRNNDGKDVENV